MPRPIKRRTARLKTEAGNEVMDIISSVGESASAYRMQVSIVLGVLALAAFFSVGFYFYSGSIERKLEGFLYEGYKQYFGLYGAKNLAEADRMEKALGNFRNAYDLRKSPLSLYYMAGCYYALGKYGEARESLSELSESFPRDDRFMPLAHYKMAMVEMKAERPDEALKALEKLYGLGAASSYKDLALVESARILDGLGRNEEAVRKYMTITEDFPGSPFLEEAVLRVMKEEEEEEEEYEAGGGGKG
jgi:tetratricopeptide (TPR) repeat protein